MSDTGKEIRESAEEEKSFESLRPTAQDEIYDALAFLCEISFGDVRSRISEEGFEAVAVEGLRAFRRSHYRSLVEDAVDLPEEELNDLRLLHDSLESVDVEIKRADNPDRIIQLQKERVEILAAIERVEEEEAMYARLKQL